MRKILINHDDADDVTQNTFVRIYYALDAFREESKLYTWIYRIATNEAITFINKKKASLYTDWESVEYQLSENLVNDPYFDGNQVQLKLQQAILTLPEKQRIVFNMKYFDQMKYEDMSEVLETSVGALKASYHHAVKKIEKYFGIN
ncbi:MAG: RNA polymerase sigma factor [Bacteroidetes bacterium]|nr:RNA polymerase sigma factor [Bacteroidota bacterium]